MASRIRSSSPRVEDAGADYKQHGRTLMDLVVHIVAHKPSTKQDRGQSRVLIKFAMAMMATLRGAPRAESRVHLSDLDQLDDAQFERVIDGLQHMRATGRRRRKEADQAH